MSFLKPNILSFLELRAKISKKILVLQIREKKIIIFIFLLFLK